MYWVTDKQAYRLAITDVISDDGTNVSQTITYCDNLIDDVAGDHELAKDIAEAINKNQSVVAGHIPLETPTIAYERPYTMEPTRPFLAQNHPNPFASTTTIRMSLPAPGNYRIQIFDAAGRLVWWSGASSQSTDVWVLWDGTDQLGRTVKPGVYFYRASASGMEMTRRMVVNR